MQLVLAEQPLLSSVMLVIVAMAMIYHWMQTGKKPALFAGLFLLLLVPSAFALASYWVTDREQISEAIFRTADAVANNDFDRAVRVIEPAQRDKIAAAKSDLMRFHFNEARVTKIRSIDVLANAVPPEAEVDMSVSVVVSDHRGQISDMRVIRRVILQFHKSPAGEWLVYDYNHLPIVGDPDGFSPHR